MVRPLVQCPGYYNEDRQHLVVVAMREPGKRASLLHVAANTTLITKRSFTLLSTCWSIDKPRTITPRYINDISVPRFQITSPDAKGSEDGRSQDGGNDLPPPTFSSILRSTSHFLKRSDKPSIEDHHQSPSGDEKREGICARISQDVC